MKKSLFLIAALASLVLTSCGGDPNEEAANALCECFKVDEAASEAIMQAMDDPEKFDELTAADDAKKKKCTDEWLATYKIKKGDINFRLKLQEIDKGVYEDAVEMGVIE
ncbi:MAG: hypothetical protein A3D92_14600 [Bacteroidetes bacterium RIFCSPHIGHO2_02_FULL_44_7]|nr:MAG: hypothetical protein A3D92_14600 [Bacteroidetes bacterium RIFCSPHIGHO2_02_FULL_44_7]